MAKPAEHGLRFEAEERGSYRVLVDGELAGFVSRYEDVRSPGKPWKWSVCRPFVARTVADRCRTLAEARKAVAAVLPEKPVVKLGEWNDGGLGEGYYPLEFEGAEIGMVRRKRGAKRPWSWKLHGSGEWRDEVNLKGVVLHAEAERSRA